MPPLVASPFDCTASFAPQADAASTSGPITYPRFARSLVVISLTSPNPLRGLHTKRSPDHLDRYITRVDETSGVSVTERPPAGGMRGTVERPDLDGTHERG